MKETVKVLNSELLNKEERNELYKKALEKIQKYLDKKGKGLRGDLDITLSCYKGIPWGVRAYFRIDYNRHEYYFWKYGRYYYEKGFGSEVANEKFIIGSLADISYYEMTDIVFVKILNSFFMNWEAIKRDIDKTTERLREYEKTVESSVMAIANSKM